GVILNALVGGLAPRLAEAPEVKRVGAKVLRDALDRREPIAPAAQPAMQKQHWPPMTEDLVVNHLLIDDHDTHRDARLCMSGDSGDRTYREAVRLNYTI